MMRAVLWKEWREHRWRGVLGALVMATLSASLVRAQIVTTAEAVVILFGPLGLLMAIFLAMGSVATEREDGTWDFLAARPIRRGDLLRAKWLLGAIQLLAMLLLAGIAAHAAAASRGQFDLEPPPPQVAEQLHVLMPAGNSPLWLWSVVFSTSVSLLGWYTALFLVLTRARNELHAGLGGLLLTLAVLAWLLQYFAARTLPGVTGTLVWGSVMLNPLGGMVTILDSLGVRTAAIVTTLLVWVVLPLCLVGRLDITRRTR